MSLNARFIPAPLSSVCNDTIKKVQNKIFALKNIYSPGETPTIENKKTVASTNTSALYLTRLKSILNLCFIISKIGVT